MEEKRIDIAKAVAAVARIEAIPPLLRLASEISGTGVALLAHVAGNVWTACAVQECMRSDAKPIEAPLPGSLLRIESGPDDRRLQVPIVLASGRRFGVLCTHDEMAEGAQARTASMFKHLAEIIALQLDQLESRDLEQNAFLDERSAGQLREQFIAILGHDLRNPLQAIYMSSDSLTRQSLDPRVSSVASRIKSNARRMSLLIDDVLDFARGRLGGGINVELTQVDNINAGIARVVQELQDAQPEREIVSNISVGRPVSCDLGRIQQVASNLLANALTHGQADSPITIAARVEADDMVLEVCNGGAPIPQDSIGKMFEPFWRHSPSASGNGLGLGLYICSQIVRAHRGKISVTSSRESGTQFTVLLPLAAITEFEATFDTAISA